MTLPCSSTVRSAPRQRAVRKVATIARDTDVIASCKKQGRNGAQLTFPQPNPQNSQARVEAEHAAKPSGSKNKLQAAALAQR